ncbi:hypothetical protein [Wolbachia endosymbiont of Trichogramma pretiosum]|uniref:hypothetical protein n=1 Tax=Wolbachia endosymbiont of Trichogramma pretiosum TaxID=125593 RepID=UPI0008392F50|nr:hypothetical protein [Wolbachia endosymbiont of Trichogramma pretiosum]OCA06359.1 putative membrane WF-2 domain protein [Wolbachia endosymbiont of Trichogramma pretiosum]
MFAGQNNNQELNNGRVMASVERIINVYNNTGKIKNIINIALLVSMIPSCILLSLPFSLLPLLSHLFGPRGNEKQLPAWKRNIIGIILSIFFVVPVICSFLLGVLPAVCLWLLNRSLFDAICQLGYLIQQAPEEERPVLLQGLMEYRFVAQTTHDPSAVASINLSVDRLIEKYKANLSKGEFYVHLNRGNTTDVEEYIKQSNEFTEGDKSHALECLRFINRTGDNFKDNHSKLTLKQAAILCWKACNDRNTVAENQRTPLNNEYIKNRKDMFLKGLVDAATTYGEKGQSCAGGTYNKLFESLSGLHPLVVITLDAEESRTMIKQTIIQEFPKIARANLTNFPGEEQERIISELSELSSKTVRYIMTTSSVLEKRCQEFSSRLNNNKKNEILEECMSNLSFVNLESPIEIKKENCV